MSLSTRVGLLAGASALSLAGVSFAADTPQDYEARIAELEAKVSELGGSSWMTEERTEEIRAVVQDVLADADTRASLLQGMSGGYDDGFVLGTSDGSFSLRLNGQVQARYNWNNADSPPAPGDENIASFEIARAKLMFSGNIAGPEWVYYIESNFVDGTGAFTLEDAWVGYDIGNDWMIKAGQFKTPVQREYLVHSSNQLLVERSLQSYQYATASRTQGVMAEFRQDQFHFMGTFSDGTGAANTTALTRDTEYAFGARGEFLLSGNWGAFQDMSSAPGSEQGVMVGVASMYQSGEYGTTAIETQTWFLSGDISFEFDGANLFFGMNYADNDFNGVGSDTSPYGLTLQGGMFFNDTVEGFVRYEWNDFDDAGDDLSIITAGINSFYNDNVKATLDFGWGLNEIRGASGIGSITGWRDDTASQDGQFLLRTQLQLTF